MKLDLAKTTTKRAKGNGKVGRNCKRKKARGELVETAFAGRLQLGQVWVPGATMETEFD